MKDRALILQCLVEGNSIRAISRITGASKTTVAKLLVEFGLVSASYQSEHLINLTCKRIQVDEIWSYIYARQRNVHENIKDKAGSAWTWIALCPDSKLIATWFVGTREAESADSFMMDLAPRLNNRIQLTSDGHPPYIDAVEKAFGTNVDYAMTVKNTKDHPMRKKQGGAYQKCVMGNPDPEHISTSYIERQNLTMRMCMRRFVRRTNGFSKKAENHYCAISLYFMYYNFIRIHRSLDVTPAMAAGVTDTLWSMEDLVRLVDDGYNADAEIMKHLEGYQF